MSSIGTKVLILGDKLILDIDEVARYAPQYNN
ncbi:hypothetical protein IX332_001566 [Porphyromonas levii]|nr:hypothetical protein [Porphyromonas levii]MBR8715091.1 hypothetical protein [Porphyromonas levii]MBR8730226.1 hypothetical protein [Porphyromonas levii]MBR8731394.1 hypothetical protein [Porphyromonas levii]MBR8735952.1 hypothetical protein [Porphyromonas levii]